MARSHSFFGALRHLAVKVDDETHELKEKMTGERCKSKPEDTALLLLELQNEMKTLYVSESNLPFLTRKGGGGGGADVQTMTLYFRCSQESVNKTLLDLKKNDGHCMELVPLCQTVVVQQAEKLSNIEEYISKYGYVAPDVQSSRIVNSSNDDGTAGNDVEQRSMVSFCHFLPSITFQQFFIVF